MFLAPSTAKPLGQLRLLASAWVSAAAAPDRCNCPASLGPTPDMLEPVVHGSDDQGGWRARRGRIDTVGPGLGRRSCRRATSRPRRAHHRRSSAQIGRLAAIRERPILDSCSRSCGMGCWAGRPKAALRETHSRRDSGRDSGRLTSRTTCGQPLASGTAVGWISGAAATRSRTSGAASPLSRLPDDVSGPLRSGEPRSGGEHGAPRSAPGARAAPAPPHAAARCREGAAALQTQCLQDRSPGKQEPA